MDEVSYEEKKVNRLDTRTGCKAFIRFANKEGTWKVVAFNAEHNHELATPEERHLLKSGRCVSKPKAGVIDSMVSAGIKTKDDFSYMSKEVGGVENIGFTKRDCYNFVNKQKMTMISAGDAQSLINLFKARQAEDPMFFYTVQVDQENRMTNFFWRDGRSRIDYDCFGDVVAFDITYHTNKYDLICTPFVGVNRHWKNVMFGCPFLLDETTASFEWLFKSFMESMGNRPPITIFTDQDQAMSNAIQSVFSTSRHRLCQWHIGKNAPSYLGELNVVPEFTYLFHKCLKDCDTEIEFEHTWGKMVQKYNLGNHRWLNSMYKIREKWSTAFTKDVFTAEIKSSQRNESMNNVLTSMADKTISLTRFMIAFEQLVADKRSSELNKDFRCKQGAASMLVKRSGILDHASRVYTNKLFKVFKRELLDSIAFTWREVATRDELSTFEVCEEGSQKVFVFNFNATNDDISCSCKKFESMGILCRHALRILSIKNVTRIPARYILKSWTKEAKKGLMHHEQHLHELKNNNASDLIWRNNMIRIASNAIYKGQYTNVTRQICEKKLLELDEEIEKEIARLRLGEKNIVEIDEAN